MPFSFRLLFLAALELPVFAPAQTRPALADTTRTEPDQELDNFSGRYHGIHVLSAQLRGVRATNKTVYWVSANGRQLSAYQAGRRLWLVDVVTPFRAEIPAAHIASLVLASNIIFVKLGRRGMAEVDRSTGRIVAKYFDRAPTNLVAD
ncbi:hypothetical protein GO988_04460 [Hymenobacter sp. HMF4947]|uniref:Uncharacterized protein n=1 Tax=Hymenobacter ginkgonis TaxID=2682976 RepID=A0A7K1TB83_9BACT|nr:hypothetical protein [Hymenobacter ginkgonis]MVN75572.1 hypothetical protein [Hymenobacter ginkgonis]